jgi:hypothetical protein
MWAVIFCALSALGSIGCLLAALSLARRAKVAAELPHQKVRSVESRLLLLERSLNDQQELLTELANKVKMTKLRNVVRHGSNGAADPDPYSQPDEWRKMMGKRLAEAKLGVKL